MGFITMSRILVLLILIANMAACCQGKAFSEADRGKRYYSPDQSAGLHQTYDSQSNAEHWMKGKFYQPEIDGQPIYIPPADFQGSYNEFLDAYYKSYTPAWSLETPAPPTYDAKSIYKNTEDPVVKLAYNKDDVKYANPKKSQFTDEMSTSEDYDDPEIVEKITDKKFSKENSDLVTLEPEGNRFEVEMIQSEDYSNPESEDYDAPQIVDKTILTELGNKKSDLEVSDLEISNLPESLKKTKLPETKPKDYNQYDQPAIKTVKRKQTANSKKSTQKKTNVYTTNLPLNTEDYDKPVIHKTVKAKPKNERPPVPKYSDQASSTPATRKKTKGKRRKQNVKSKSQTGDYTANPGSTLNTITVDEVSYEQSKNDEVSYEQSKNDDKYVNGNPIKVKEKVVVKAESEGKTSEKIKTNTQKKPVKIEEKVVVKSDSKSKTVPKPVKIKEKEVVKTDTQYQPNKKEKEVVKTDTQYQPNKKEKEVVKADTQYQPNRKEKVIIKPDFNDKPTVKYDNKELEKDVLTRQLSIQTDINSDRPLEDQSDLADELDITEVFQEKVNSDTPAMETNLDSGTSKSEALEKKDSNFPNPNDFRGLSAMNSNIWSMLFNPQAEQNRLKQKRCITRANETGFCTYIQNCEVPHIATSLEQLLNNACVIDDIFIGVCCPEFPVQTVKVHWDQTSSEFDNHIEDEFGTNAEDCGIKSNEASKLQSWPWKAPLVSMSNGKIFCGGVVVSQDHVLTAAHCTTKIPKNQILVRLGQFDDGSGDDYAVIEIKRHAQYNPRTMHNDVALLKLGRRIMNDAHIGIVCLPDEDGKNDHDGETATLLGWRGIFGTKSRDPEFLEVISNKECENRLGMKVPNTLLCTETRKESERTCNADSGAPLIIEEDGKYEVIGILSWNRNDCNQRFPSTFSRVSSYIGWIKNHLS